MFLAILDEYRDKNGEEAMAASMKAWRTLVHVCRRWRTVVFGSPRHLNLRLVCTYRTPASDTLVVWPALPLVICCHGYSIQSVDNIVALLGRSNHVHQIDIDCISNIHLETVLAAMQVPFPELTNLNLILWLNTSDETVRVLPDSFLGGSAPRLQTLHFRGIPFPGLPKLLLSTIHLVNLFLYGIPRSGYISPEAMATALSTLTSLDTLYLHFQSPQSFQDMASRRPPPPKPFVLPVLTEFQFKGVSEYLDDLVARIEAPRLFSLYIRFFNQTLFGSPQLVRFISCTPGLKAFEEVHLIFGFIDIITSVRLKSPTSNFEMEISCSGLDQVSSLQQVCTSRLLPLSVENLYIYGTSFDGPYRRDNVENPLWLELLQRFTAVKNLYLREQFARHIGPTLQELVEGRMSEFLPSLRNIFLEGLQTSGPVHEGIQQFVATRQASCPIAVSRWDRDARIF
jgi:hypothetical protein